MTANQLRLLIRRSGMTRQEAATLLGVSRRTLQRWLVGGARLPAARAKLIGYVLGGKP